MRRSLSLFSSVAIAATSLVALSHSPVSAAATATTIRNTATSPSPLNGATANRAARLARSNQMLVVGRDASTDGTNLHVWKVNDDLSFDTSFGAVDLGANFASPTASNSACLTRNNNQVPCSSVSTFTVNEVADRFALTYMRYINGTGSSSSTDMAFNTIAIGKISTGEILSTIVTPSYTLYSNTPLANWSHIGAVDLAKTMCESGVGSTYNSVALATSYLNSWSTMIRPDGSLVMSIDCNYSNRVDGQAVPSSLTEYEMPLYFALKSSGASLVVDTSFGTNGFKTLFDGTTTCGNTTPTFTANTAITSNSSTALFAPLSVWTYPRSTTVPNNSSFNGVTSYSGCDFSSSSGYSNYETKLISIQANGTTKSTVSFPAGFDYFISRWVIDPQGRWNASVRPFQLGGQQGPSQTATQFVRLLPDGTFDPSNGTNGIKEMSSLPRTVEVNGTTINMNYSISGYATTATGILFTGFASASTFNCAGSPPYSNSTTTLYPYYVSPENGLLTSFGTNGLGDGVTLENLGSDSCSSAGIARASFVNSSGQHQLFAQLRAIGSQSAGLAMTTWQRAEGVTGGGEGVGAVGATGRTDTKVYSRRLPTTTQVDTTLNVLTKKASRTEMLRSRTPKVCVALTQSIVLVKTGTCTVQIVDRATKNVVRSLSTRVRDTESTVGTTVSSEDTIRFNRVSTRLSASARAQIAELATTAAEAQRVILIGHTALLTENTVSNNRIALQRAARVKAELQKQFKAAGVKVPISIVSMGSQAPISTKKSESRQSVNRRVEVYLIP